MKFSEREGITPARTPLQVNSVDEALKNSLWNVLHDWIIKPMLDSVYSDEYIFSINFGYAIINFGVIRHQRMNLSILPM
jgi:hypothetical protein